MNAFLPDMADFAARAFLEIGLQYFYVFILVAFRLSGLVVAGPIFSQPAIPPTVRVLLVLGLGLVLTPVIQRTASLDVARHDSNRDGLLTFNEAPDHLHGRLRFLLQEEASRREAGPAQAQARGQAQGQAQARARARARARDAEEAVPVSAFESSFSPPATLTGLLRDILAEFSLGFLLSLGVTTFLSGLQLSGKMIDQQLGLEFGQIVNPALGGGASVSSQMMFLLGGVCFLLMEPVGGHVMLLSALIETFDAMPVGEAVLFSGAGTLFTELVQKSLLLAVQVAAPVLAVMGLVTLSMGFLGHSVPQINQLVVGFPVRSLAGLMIMSVSLTGVGRVLVDAIPEVIGDVQSAVTSYQ